MVGLLGEDGREGREKEESLANRVWLKVFTDPTIDARTCNFKPWLFVSRKNREECTNLLCWWR